jgi:hypothetical protein
MGLAQQMARRTLHPPHLRIHKIIALGRRRWLPSSPRATTEIVPVRPENTPPVLYRVRVDLWAVTLWVEEIHAPRYLVINRTVDLDSGLPSPLVCCDQLDLILHLEPQVFSPACLPQTRLPRLTRPAAVTWTSPTSWCMFPLLTNPALISGSRRTSSSPQTFV